VTTVNGDMPLTVASDNTYMVLVFLMCTRDCNPGIPNTDPDLFINPEIPGFGGPDSGISGLKIY